jgi:hypothetical protein
MIITTEKYKDTYIVYIDETVEDIDDLPAHVGFECLRTSTEMRISAILDFRRRRLGERMMNLL